MKINNINIISGRNTTVVVNGDTVVNTGNLSEEEIKAKIKESKDKIKEAFKKRPDPDKGDVVVIITNSGK